MKVWPWPACIGGETLYSDPWRLRRTMQWDGAPGQLVEVAQRTRVEIAGEIVRANAPDFDIMIARLEGGRNLVAVWDMEMRLQSGWDNAIASIGDGEMWHRDGLTSTWVDETPGGVWRSIFVTGSGSAGSTSLGVSGVISGEVIPRGTWVRAGEYRYRTATTVTSPSTLVLATPLVEAVSGDVRLPGDLFVGRLIGAPEVGRADVNGVRTFSLSLIEVYEDEVDDDFEYQAA